MKNYLWLVVPFALCFAVAESSADLLPLGPEIQVNPENSFYHSVSATALALDGSAMVIWNGDNGAGKRARTLSTLGIPVGDQFSVNPPPDPGFALENSAAVSSSGKGVTCWRNSSEVYCRLFDTHGVWGEATFQVNEQPSGPIDQVDIPQVAEFPDGSFVVVWLLFYDPEVTGYYLSAVQSRFFDASGQPTGPQFELVRDIPITSLQAVDVATLGGQRAVVVWNDPRADGSGDGILARIVARSGQPQGEAFLVNTYTDRSQERVAIASNDNDRFVVAWESDRQDGFYKGIYGQLFDGQGAKIGNEFQVSSNAPTDQDWPEATMDRLGNFIIAHYSFQEEEDLVEDTFLHAYRADGTPKGSQVRANEQILYQQQYASLDLSDAGLLQVSYDSWRQNDDGDYNFDIMTRRFVISCELDAHTLCLGAGGRFQVRAFWRTADGAEGAGSPLPLTTDTGGFTFFSPGNFELLVKVLDACGVNGHYWIFAAGLTDVGVDLVVTDTYTGEVQTFANPVNQAFAPIQRLDVLAGCSASPPGLVDAAAKSAPAAVAESPQPSAEHGACSADPAVLCFRDGRFRVTATWQDFLGQSGSATAFPVSDESGLFYFFTPGNLELAVKVLDGCAINDRYWVFAVGLTNVRVVLDVEDLATGQTWHRDTQLGETFPAVLDTAAFATCP